MPDVIKTLWVLISVSVLATLWTSITRLCKPSGSPESTTARPATIRPSADGSTGI